MTSTHQMITGIFAGCFILKSSVMSWGRIYIDKMFVLHAATLAGSLEPSGATLVIGA